ncbi:MAG TPA: MAPEG family protein, partial [Sphingomicrobium sp.]|nr:MAPEG family protein [Sphingomicrobium sp.]
VPVTLISGASAVVVNAWLGSRIGRLRHELKVSIGDGGQEPLIRRMRAQANFIENAPIFLILLGALELSGANRIGLAGIAAIFFVARIAHAMGMDGGSSQPGRKYGIILSGLASIVLAIWALVCAFRLILGG